MENIPVSTDDGVILSTILEDNLAIPTRISKVYTLWRDFPKAPGLRLHSSTAGGTSSIPGWGSKNPHAMCSMAKFFLKYILFGEAILLLGIYLASSYAHLGKVIHSRIFTTIDITGKS